MQFMETPAESSRSDDASSDDDTLFHSAQVWGPPPAPQEGRTMDVHVSSLSSEDDTAEDDTMFQSAQRYPPPAVQEGRTMDVSSLSSEDDTRQATAAQAPVAGQRLASLSREADKARLRARLKKFQEGQKRIAIQNATPSQHLANHSPASLLVTADSGNTVTTSQPRKRQPFLSHLDLAILVGRRAARSPPFARKQSPSSFAHIGSLDPEAAVDFVLDLALAGGVRLLESAARGQTQHTETQLRQNVGELESMLRRMTEEHRKTFDDLVQEKEDHARLHQLLKQSNQWMKEFAEAMESAADVESTYDIPTGPADALQTEFHETTDIQPSPSPDLATLAKELPAGWGTAISRSSGELYYINTVSGESTYDRPYEPRPYVPFDDADLGT
eukprot:COSAG02_NODE_12908_length_1473_cov_13.466285_1_plen_386_part_10